MQKLLDMLKRHEGVESHVYRCSAGFETIGAGRNISKSGLGLSDDEVDYLLENDIVRVIKELSSEYPWFKDLDDVRKDAIIDISFNLGATRLRGFKRALAAMDAADYKTASISTSHSVATSAPSLANNHFTMITSGNTLICLSFALLLMRNDPRQNSLAIIQR